MVLNSQHGLVPETRPRTFYASETDCTSDPEVTSMLGMELGDSCMLGKRCTLTYSTTPGVGDLEHRCQNGNIIPQRTSFCSL